MTPNDQARSANAELVKRPWLRRLGLCLTVGVVASATTLLVARARAAGIPDKSGLTYTGYLESPDGKPLAGTHAISVRFWNSELAKDPLCIGELGDSDLVAGRFQVSLPDSCVAAVQANPNLLVDVQVDDGSLGRTKVGAVPYAIEAAGAASATGDLEKRIAALEARGDVRSARISSQAKEVPDVDWISGVTSSGTGTYAIDFAKGVFAAAPACVATSIEGNSNAPIFECYSASANGITCVAKIDDPDPAHLGIFVNSGMSLLCVAPR